MTNFTEAEMNIIKVELTGWATRLVAEIKSGEAPAEAMEDADTAVAQMLNFGRADLEAKGVRTTEEELCEFMSDEQFVELKAVWTAITGC